MNAPAWIITGNLKPYLCRNLEVFSSCSGKGSFYRELSWAQQSMACSNYGIIVCHFTTQIQLGERHHSPIPKNKHKHTHEQTLLFRSQTHFHPAPSPPGPHYVFPGIGPLVFLQKNSKYPTKKHSYIHMSFQFTQNSGCNTCTALGEERTAFLELLFQFPKRNTFQLLLYILPIFLGRGMPILLVFCYSVLGIYHCLFSVKTEDCISVGILVIHLSTQQTESHLANT